MKLILRVLLSLALVESFLCGQLFGSNEGNYPETSNSWGIGVGIDSKFGLEAGFKDGHATLGSTNHFAANIEGHKGNRQKDLYHATGASPPNNFGSGVGYAYGMPNNPASGAPYYTQYGLPPPASQFAPQWPQYSRQQALQFTPQYYDYVPQYARAPQYPPQNTPPAPQFAPQWPQYARQQALQFSPQY